MTSLGLLARERARRVGPSLAQVRGLASVVATPALLGLAVSVRAAHVLRADFPLNDGGLFYAMAEDIQAAGFRLPEFSAYNDAAIPFAYPPLGLYLAAAADALTPIGLLDWLRILPLVGASLAVWAFLLLARTLLRNRTAALLATLAFALAPRSFVWLLMGGGLTRSFGLAFALLALREGVLLVESSTATRRRFVSLAVLIALTLLTHLETAAFLVVSLGLVGVWRWRRGLILLPAAGVLAALIAAPWWVAVVARHGIEPFVAATDHGGSLLDNQWIDPWVLWVQVRDGTYTSEPFFPLIAALGVLGGAYALSRGRWLLPVWWVVIVALSMRAFPTFSVVPTALLAGMTIHELLLPAMLREGARGVRWQPLAGVAAVGAGALVFATFGALDRTNSEGTFLRGIGAADLAAMQWAAAHAPEDARFLVAPRGRWYADRTTEWFPALTGRVNVATPQGYEWLEQEFGLRARLHDQARHCAQNNATCLDELASTTGLTHIYVPADCCTQLANSLRSDRSYVVVYDEGGALIARRR